MTIQVQLCVPILVAHNSFHQIIVACQTYSLDRTVQWTDLSIDGWHGQLQVTMGDISLAEVESAPSKELLANGREGSITADNEVYVDMFLVPIGPENIPKSCNGDDFFLKIEP